MTKQELKESIINALEKQGFTYNAGILLDTKDKNTYHDIQLKARKEYLIANKEFIEKGKKIVKKHSINGKEIDIDKINLELRPVSPRSMEEKLFRWWNLTWWSIPYQQPYGRQMRFLLWDKGHDAPFGLISLQSPVLKMAVRDRYLELPKETLDYWVNMSMNAQRVGALPPYNYLIGSKMVALSLTCDEIRKFYTKKYSNYTSQIIQRNLPATLLYITTTSAFGRSSVYNRLKYNNELAAFSLGYTKGSGSFHIPDCLYKELILILEEEGKKTSRSFGDGPSRKLKLIGEGLKLLGIKSGQFHGLEREFFLFPLVNNLKEVIHENAEPIWLERSFNDLFIFWKKRWCVNRAKTTSKWRNFEFDDYFNKLIDELKE